MSILFICATAITLIVNVTAASVPGVNNANDDQVQDIITANTTLNIIISAVSLAMAIVGLVGARIYNVWMLMAVVVWYLVNYALYIWTWIANINEINNLPQTTTPYRTPVGLIILQAVVTGLWIYPHVGLIVEIQKGIMTRETYPREEYSCCCTDKPSGGAGAGRRYQ